MNKYKIKKITLILSVLSVFLIIGAASATSDSISQDDVLTLDDSVEVVDAASMNAVENQVVSSGESEILSNDSAGTFTDLNDLIENADENSTVTLDRNYSFDSTTDNDYILGINITKAITLDGKGFTIDALNSARIFNITSTNVILSNITFVNARTFGDGNVGGDGAVIWWSGTGTIENCEFINNTAIGSGGALFIIGTDVNVLNCNFTANTAIENGGAIYIMNSVSNCKINSTFVNNSAYRGGAIFFNNETDNVIIDGYFEGNEAERIGGAICFQAKATNNIISAEFYNNRAKEASGGAIFFRRLAENNQFEGIFTANYAVNGGAIFFYNKTNNNRFNSDFRFNVANSSGGAIVFFGATDDNNFTGSFINNSALGVSSDDDSGNGGAITFTGVSSNCFFACDFINNTAVKHGGAVNYRQTPYNITFNGNFINNKASYGGGVNFFESMENVVFNGKFTDNHAIQGGAIAAKSGSIENAFFKNNSAETGGAIYFNESGSVINCNFTDNQATGPNGEGGAVYFYNNGNVTNCNFEDNYDVPIIWLRAADQYANINNNAFIGNSQIKFESSSAVKNISDNWYGENDPNVDVPYLNVRWNKVYDSLVDGEWNGVLDVYFVRNGSEERVDLPIRQVTYNVTSNNAEVEGEFMDVYGKLYPTSSDQNVVVTAKVDNQELSELVFGVSNHNGFTELQNLIRGTKANETLVLNNNYTYNPDDEQLIEGIVIDKPITIALNGSYISGNNTAKNIFNIISDGVVLENMSVKDVNGTPITAVGDNIQINNLVAEHVSEPAIEVIGDDAVINNVNLIEHAGVAVMVTGDNATITNVKSPILTGVNIIVDGDINIDAEADDVFCSDSAVVYVNAGVDGAYIAKVNGKNYDVTVRNGTGSSALDVLPVGTYNVTVIGQFGPDSPISIASTSFSVIDITLPEIVANETTEVPIDLPEDATGNVSVIVDGEVVDTKELANGSAVLEIPELEAGQHNITISYPGNDEHNAFNKTFDTIAKVDTGANITLPEILENETTEIPIDLPEDATGNVSVIVDGEVVDIQELVNGSAILEIPELEAGHHNISVIYPGDEKYATINQTSDVPVKVDEDFNVTVPEFYESETTEIPVELPEDATGNVTVMVDGEIADTKELVNGSAVLEIPPLSKEDHNISVIYPGDDKYASKMEEFNITVLDDIIVTAENLTKYYSTPDKFIINVTDGKGRPLVNKTVQVILNGRNYTKYTNENGTIAVSIGLPSGEYNVTVTADNITLNRTITVLSTINGTDLVKIFRNGTQYYVTAKDANGTYLKEGSSVEFNINGVFYTRKVVGDEGLVKLNINLPPGEFIITARNLETNESCSNTITVLPTVNSTDLELYYKNGTKFTVQALDETGNPVGAGEKVTFNINGVKYTRTTNETGYASLNINLPAGNYTVSTTYNNCTVANNICVKPTLVTEDLVMKYRDGSVFTAKVLDGQGNPLASQTVKFNINGVLYSRDTDVNGTAKLNIALPSGEYIITSTSQGATTSNTITIEA